MAGQPDRKTDPKIIGDSELAQRAVGDAVLQLFDGQLQDQGIQKLTGLLELMDGDQGQVVAEKLVVGYANPAAFFVGSTQGEQWGPTSTEGFRLAMVRQLREFMASTPEAQSTFVANLKRPQ